MSKKPAALPIFGDAYLADTMHLSLEEHGAYFLLMLAAWRASDCALPDDDVKLARICRCSTKRFKTIRDNVLEMWDLTPAGWVQKRLKKEHDYVSKKSEHNRRAAEARWNSQPTENIEPDECERTSERNAPPPPPIEEPNGSISDAAHPSRERLPTADAVDEWNRTAAPIGWPGVQKLSDTRRQQLNARLRDGGIEGWNAAIARAAASPYLGGAPPPSWFTFDWLIKATNYLKLIEGNYDRKRSTGPGPDGPGGRGTTSAAADRAMDDLAPFWPTPAQGDGGRPPGDATPLRIARAGNA